MKKCKQGYYYCYTEKKCKKIPMGYHLGVRGYLAKDNDNDGESEDTNKNGNGDSNGGSDGGGVSESIISEKRDGKSAKDKGYSLRDWFKGGGWKQTGGKYDGKPCAKQPGQKTKPYCRDADDRAAMSKDERNKAAAKKRKEDPNPNRKGKAKMVTQNNSFEPEANVVEEEKKKKKDACYHKVKSRYSVWPSAYASGALVKCRKAGAANWGNKSEETDYDTFRKRAEKIVKKNKEKTLKGEIETKKEEWIVDNAAQYFFNEGINEEGLAIFIEELGVENFVEFVHDLAEDSELIEAYALTGKKKTPKRLPKGTQPAKTTKATIARGDRTIKATSPSGAFKKRPAAAKAVETAKEKQPEKKPVKSTLAKSVADTLARGALSAWQGHKAAMKKKKEGGSVASQIGAGLGVATGAMLKKGKKHLSDDYDYSNWRDEFKAMEYEFIDIIKPEPLVTEASFEIKHTSADVRKAEKQKKIDALAQKGSTDGERRAAARKAGTSLPPIQKNHVELEGEQIDELKCWKGYKRKKGAVPGAKGSCVKESEQIDEIAPVVAGVARLPASAAKRKLTQKVAQKVGDTVSNRLSSEEFVDEAKDETEIGITGQPIPKRKRSPKKQYEFEKKRRENLGRNVGGKTYSADVAPYKTNPRVGYLRNEYEMENELGEARHTPTKPDLEANIGGGNLQKLSKKASKRIDYDVDGDVDPQDKVEKSKGDYGEELPTPFGKFRTGDSKKVKVKKEEVSNWKDEIDEGWKSALAGAGLATAVALHGGGSKTDKKPQPKSQSSSVERVSKEKSAMDKWKKANPELAKRADNPKPFKRKKLSPINPEWAKAHPELAKKERERRAQRGSN